MLQPEGGVRGIRRSDQGDAEIGNRQACSTNGLRHQRPVVEIDAFEQQVRDSRAAPESAELAPERAFHNRDVQAANGLSLNHATVADVIVADAQPSQLHTKPLFGEKRRHAAMPLVDIGEHAHCLANVARRHRATCVKTVSSQPLLALSRSESA
jgi:hypothetical protein